MSPLSIRRLALSLAMFAVVAFGSAAAAKADTAFITIPNSGLSGSPGPYARVDYVLSGTSINVTVTMLGTYEMFGKNDAFGFNVVGDLTGLTITNIGSELGPCPGCGFDVGTGGNMDGFGNFEFTLSDGNVGQGAHTLLTFTVSRTAGFTNANQLFEATSQGAHFAVHVAPTNGNPTGFAADAGTADTPEPASMLLLGTGLIGIAAGLRKRLRK